MASVERLAETGNMAIKKKKKTKRIFIIIYIVKSEKVSFVDRIYRTRAWCVRGFSIHFFFLVLTAIIICRTDKRETILVYLFSDETILLVREHDIRVKSWTFDIVELQYFPNSICPPVLLYNNPFASVNFFTSREVF